MAKRTLVSFVRLLLWSVAFGLAPAVLAQAEDAFQKFPVGVEEPVYRVHLPGEGNFQEARVQPPSWFVDISRKRVEVMLYDNNIAAHTLSLEGAGATMQGVSRVPNNNYLFAEVLIDASAKPNTLRFELSDGRSYPWALESAKRPRKLSPEDLIYLIMPDRFANGDTSNDSIAGMLQQGTDRSKFLFRHGGDLAGITERLDYLQELGVTALWLNPVLENDQPYESYHGYAVTDHYRIDRRLGSLADYQLLIDQAHQRDMKVLMDIVPNHAGDKHFLYADIPARDWFHQPDSFVRSNFRIPSALDPHAARGDVQQLLHGWFDHHMPDFNQSNARVRTYFEQVALWWLGRTGQDGYRVDTYPYSDLSFMAAWSEAIRQNFPSVSFFGEVWVDGLANQAAFVPGHGSPVPIGANSSVTDFQLYSALHEALQQEQTWAGGVAKLWLTLTQDYVYQDANSLITFLDNHDLTRLATAMGGDTTKIKSAITLLLTLRGTPMLYYGTELGLEGSGGGFGEGGRKDMPGGWPGDTVKLTGANIQGLSPAQQALHRHVKALANYRKAHPALATGTMTHYVPEENLYVYFRTASDSAERWMVTYNASDAAVDLDLRRYADMIGGRQPVRVIGSHSSSWQLAPKEAVLWELR